MGLVFCWSQFGGFSACWSFSTVSDVISSWPVVKVLDEDINKQMINPLKSMLEPEEPYFRALYRTHPSWWRQEVFLEHQKLQKYPASTGS
jgi:hypothetical protein